jgi:hypothetical protein
MNISPISNLLKEQKLILKELYRCHLMSPTMGVIKDGVYNAIIPEPTEYETNLQYQLDYVSKKINDYINGYENLPSTSSKQATTQANTLLGSVVQ